MDTDDPTGRSSIAHPHRASRARLGLAGAGLAAALTLSACSGISLPTGDGGQVNLDLDGDGGSLTVTDEDGNEQNIDIETDDDSFAITDGDGNNIMSGGGGTEVPEDFPSDIPLPDGELQFSSSVTVDSGDNWSLTYLVPGDPVTVTEALRGEMDSAGFEEISSWQAEDASATVMEGNGYTVSLMTADAPDSEGTSVTYTVTQQS